MIDLSKREVTCSSTAGSTPTALSPLRVREINGKLGGEHRGQRGKHGEKRGKTWEKRAKNTGKHGEKKGGKQGRAGGNPADKTQWPSARSKWLQVFFSYLTHFHAKVRLCELCLISVHFLYFTFNFTLFSPHFLIFFTRVSFAFLKPSQAELLYFCERREVSHDSNQVHRINSAKLCFVLFYFPFLIPLNFQIWLMASLSLLLHFHTPI